MERSLAIAGVALILVSSVVGGTVFLGNNSTDAGANSDNSNVAQAVESPMSVENVSIIERSDGVITAEVTVEGEIDENQLKQALSELFSDRQVEISTIRITDISDGVATVSLGTKGEASSATVETQIEDHLMNRSLIQQAKKTTATTNGSNNTTNGSVTFNSSATYYQIDLVRGQPIKNLSGPNGTYTNDELIRFAHGNNETPIRRTSDDEFTTNGTLADCIDTTPIAVNTTSDTATVEVGVSESCGNITFTLASYTKPGPIWTPESEQYQEFVDSKTITIASGETQTLNIELPGDVQAVSGGNGKAKASNTSTPEEPTETPETDEPTETSESTQTDTPTDTPDPTETSESTESTTTVSENETTTATESTSADTTTTTSTATTSDTETDSSEGVNTEASTSESSTT